MVECALCSVMADSVTPWSVARQAPLFTVFPRQEYWSELSFPSSGDLPDPGIELRSSILQADSLPSEPGGNPENQGTVTKRREHGFCSGGTGRSRLLQALS